MCNFENMADQDVKDILDMDRDPQTPQLSKEAILGITKVLKWIK